MDDIGVVMTPYEDVVTGYVYCKHTTFRPYLCMCTLIKKILTHQGEFLVTGLQGQVLIEWLRITIHVLTLLITLSQRINNSIWNSNLNLYSTLNSTLSLVLNLKFQFQWGYIWESVEYIRDSLLFYSLRKTNEG